MQYTRLYTDQQGETHFEDIDVDFSLRGRAGDQAPPFDAKKRCNSSAPKAKQNAVDWHTAPRSQFIYSGEWRDRTRSQRRSGAPLRAR